MKSFELSSKSWHYRIVAVYSPCDRYSLDKGYIDFCTYLRHLFLGIVWLIMFTVLGGMVASVMILSPGIYIVSLFDIGWHAPNAFFWVTMFFWSLIGFGCYASWRDFKDNPIKFTWAEPDREPGFWTLAYRKFKDKTCFKIEVV